MPINPAIQSDISNAPLPPQPVRTPTNPLQSASAASAAASNRINANRSTYTKRYTQQVPKYGFLIALSSFTGYSGVGGIPSGPLAQSGTAINNFINSATFLGTITLPLPIGGTMIDAQNIQYNEYKFGPGMAGVANALGPAIARIEAGAQVNTAALGGEIQSGAEQGLGALALDELQTNRFTQPFVEAGLAFGGMGINQFYTVILQGPTYNRYTLVFNLAPHNSQESDLIRDMIRTLKQAAAPDLTGAGLFWKFPDIVQCVYLPQGDNVNTYMYRFKPAVLETVQVNYAPAGSIPGFYNTTAPESVQLSLSFREIEYWIRSNFN